MITPPCTGLNHLISTGLEPQHVWEIFLMTEKFFSPPLSHCMKEAHFISGFLSQPPAITEQMQWLPQWLANNASMAPTKRDLWFGLVNHLLSLSCVALLYPFLPQEIMGSTVQQCLQTHHPSWRSAVLDCPHLPSQRGSVITVQANTVTMKVYILHNSSHCIYFIYLSFSTWYFSTKIMFYIT